MQKWVVVCWALLAFAAAAAALDCPDGATCEEGQTCCNDPDNGYECCPFDQAECCSDHTHCCPAGTTCDVDTSSCVNATVSVPWVERAPAAPPRFSKSFRMIKAYMGEDDENVCPDQSRCPPEFSCLKALTKYGCCPLAQGVPCADGKHCCPENHQCTDDGRSCVRQDLVTAVLCNDGVSECPDQTTCCENPDGTWGCCPMPKAVCCEDKLHCCPEDSACDVEHSKCISLSTKKELPMWAKLPARIREEWENKKEPEAVTAKEPENGGATDKAPDVTTANITPPTEQEVTVSSVTKGAAGDPVPCNDTVACPEETTCCKTKTGDWACCPLPEAVCCEDFTHCCPKGKKCNVAAQTCEDEVCSVPWVKKMPTIPIQLLQVGDVTCDDTTSCPDGTTCCKTTEDKWACCPLPEAVCCEDHIHCCPKGKTCNLAAQTCDGGTNSVPWVEKIPAIPKQVAQAGNVSCDSTTSCPDGSTCCKTKDDKWACCPLPQAVCCDDHEHCCPAGSTCDLATLTCQGPSGPTPMKQKTPAFPTPAQPEEEQPEEEQPEEEEPEGEEPEEEQPEGEEPVEEEKPKEGEGKNVDGTIQCDEHTCCPQSTTCCFMSETKKWGCCPLPEAVCCADGNHCCPKQYKCNEEKTSCVKGEVVIPWYPKLPASSSVQADPSAGYTCNVASSSCQKVVMLQLETIPLTPVYLPEHQSQPNPITHGDVKCDDQTSCEDGETCCRTSPTTWGCCPSPNAVCCSDMMHCCPTGYTCTEGGGCTQDTKLRWYNWHQMLANKKRALL
ncbi:hypothetical protein INR49_030426, partial [Caranx melampygus]